MSTQFNCQKHFFQGSQFSQKVLIQTIHFSISIVFVNTQISKQFYFKKIQFSVSTVSMSKTVLFQTI